MCVDETFGALCSWPRGIYFHENVYFSTKHFSYSKLQNFIFWGDEKYTPLSWDKEFSIINSKYPVWYQVFNICPC